MWKNIPDILLPDKLFFNKSFNETKKSYLICKFVHSNLLEKASFLCYKPNYFSLLKLLKTILQILSQNERAIIVLQILLNLSTTTYLYFTSVKAR